MRILLVGPMSGLPDMNFAAFHAEASRLRSAGHDVVSPAELHRDPDTALARGHLARLCVETDYLATCDGIQLLAGWDDSINATELRRCADALDLKVMAPLARLPQALHETETVGELADIGDAVHAPHRAGTVE